MIMQMAMWLTILFTGLRLAKIIVWPWYWVTAPLWAGVTLYIALMACFICFIELFGSAEERMKLRMNGWIK